MRHNTLPGSLTQEKSLAGSADMAVSGERRNLHESLERQTCRSALLEILFDVSGSEALTMIHLCYKRPVSIPGRGTIMLLGNSLPAFHFT